MYQRRLRGHMRTDDLHGVLRRRRVQVGHHQPGLRHQWNPLCLMPLRNPLRQWGLRVRQHQLPQWLLPEQRLCGRHERGSVREAGRHLPRL